MDKKTLIINLFGAPGAGKSTGAAWVFAKLKAAGVDCELVTEFAKDKVWEGNKDLLKCQFYVTGKQVWKIVRCIGKVDVIVTDSPIRIGKWYAKNNNQPKLAEALTEQANMFNDISIDVFVNRVKPYNPNGRLQTKDESDAIAKEMKQYLEEDGIKLMEINGDEDGYNRLTNYILNIISTK